MRILHVCAGWQKWNGAANIARLLMDEQKRMGHDVSYTTWASINQLRTADEVWIHCGWLPCLWWAALWGRNVHWMPEACYDPVRLGYHGWKKRLAGPFERFSLRLAKTIIATCKAEKGWIQKYLGRRCPTVKISDIKRFFKFPLSSSKLALHNPMHLLYLGRRHPLKGLEYLELAVKDNDAVEFQVVSNAFGEEKDKVWEWCDVLVLPTLSENFGLVVAEALERGKRVITTDGAPAWGNGNDYGGRLIYIRGFIEGSDSERIAMLKQAIESQQNN